MLLSFLFSLALRGLGDERFTIFYPVGYKQEARITLYYLKKYYKHADRLTGGRVKHLTVVIEDIGSISNGYANPLVPTVKLFTNIPYPDFHFGTMRSWWRTVSLHEYTHISQITNVSGIPAFLRYIFGRVFLPNVFHPLYIHEGITVFTESSIVPYEGRLNEGYYDAYKNLLAVNKKLPSLPYLKHLPLNYPGYGLAYLIGGEYTEYLSGDSALSFSFKKGNVNLARYYSKYGSHLFYALFFDLAFSSVFGKSKVRKYSEWRDYEYRNAEYKTVDGKVVALAPRSSLPDGLPYSYARQVSSRLMFTHVNRRGIYVFRQIVKPLSFDFPLSYGEVIRIDPEKHTTETVIRGYVTLPMKGEGDVIYVALMDLRRGGKNFFLKGFRVVSSIYRISGRKKKRVFTGDIKAFAVKNGVIYYSVKEGLGSVIYRGGTPYYKFRNILVQDMEFDSDGNLILIGYREGDGNNLYMLTRKKVLKKLINEDFTISGIKVDGKDIYFSANFKGKWQAYRYDLETGETFLIEGDQLAAYPVRYRNKVYYITLTPHGEVLKEVPYREKPVLLRDYRHKIPIPPVVGFRRKHRIRNLLTLLWPDLLLPYFLPETEYNPQMYGVFLTGEDALQINTYYIFFGKDTSFKYEIGYMYGGIPYTDLMLRVVNDNSSGIYLDHILYARNIGFLRKINISSGLYPFMENILITPEISLFMKPTEKSELYFYSGGYTGIKEGSHGVEFGMKGYFPSGFFVLVPQFSYGRSTDSISIKLSSGEAISGPHGMRTELRITMPLFSVNRGVNFIHFFLERFYLSMESEAGISHENTIYDLMAYITADMSVVSGNFKLSPSLGAGYSPEKGFFPVIGLGASLNPVKEKMEFNLSLGRVLKESEWRVSNP